ncbi:MAG: PTS sugar transporter subunit IIC [Candidatus Eremiobacteraeota bacterium]|nr:PTS sugar transporter subunit IIC [Candidatus Eremiobacteraeota bacterium]
MRRFGDAPALVAIRRALPWSLIGLGAAIPLFFVLAPQPSGGFAAMFEARMAFALLPSFAVMAIVLVFLLARELALQLKITLLGMLISAPAAFFLSPPPGSHTDVVAYLHALGTVGLFLAIALALLCAALFVIVQRAAPPRWHFAAGFSVAVVIVACAFILFRLHISPAQAILIALRPLSALGDTYAALLAITVVETALWIAGIHGPATLAAIVTPVYLTLQLQNTNAFSNHAALPHVVVVSTFLFVFPGGAGATLPLVVLLLFSRAARLRNVARLTIVPAIFNLNEPLLFGLPVVFNPFLCIPFVLAPAVLATITYIAMRVGWVHPPIFYLPSSIPTVASTYLATLDWRAVVLVVANIIIAGLIYVPFVRAYDRHELRSGVQAKPA